jgi:hypothetical protein
MSFAIFLRIICQLNSVSWPQQVLIVWYGESRKRSTLSFKNRGPVTLSPIRNTIVTSHQGRLLPKSLANLKLENVENKASQISCPQ